MKILNKIVDFLLSVFHFLVDNWRTILIIVLIYIMVYLFINMFAALRTIKDHSRAISEQGAFENDYYRNYFICRTTENLNNSPKRTQESDGELEVGVDEFL